MKRSIKKNLIFITICAMILMLCSCTKKTEDSGKAAGAGTDAAQAAENTGEKQSDGEDAYCYKVHDVTVRMNGDVSEILDDLGEYKNYAESPSCAFEGIDKIYSYEGWDLYTYPQGDKDYVNSVYFTDENAQTPEGIHIGSSVEEVKTAYGEDCEDKFDTYTYTKGDSQLVIMTSDGKVDAVEYRAVVDEK